MKSSLLRQISNCIITIPQSATGFAVITLLILVTVLGTSSEGFAQLSTRRIKGIIRDSITEAPIARASIMLENTDRGVLSNDQGLFEMVVPVGEHNLTVNCLGYIRKVIPINRSSLDLYAVYLQPSATELAELKVKRSKYSKKNNPAVEFVKKIKRLGAESDPYRLPAYNYRSYRKVTIAVDNFNTDPEQSTILRKMPQLVEHIDTSALSGLPVLNIAVKENKSQTFSRNKGSLRREIVEGIRSEGIDEIADQQSMETFYDDVLREIDLYSDNINLLQNRFVSPLSKIGPDFYKYFLTDTIEVSGEPCITLAFYPRNKSMFGFNGHLYIGVNDSTMFVRRADLTVPADINLNFVDKLQIVQNFDKAPDGTRLKTSDDLQLVVRAVAGTPALYIRRQLAYTDHNFDIVSDTIFVGLGERRIEKDARQRDSTYWASERLIAASAAEQNASKLMEHLRHNKLFYWGEKFVRYFLMGYAPTGNPSKFDIGPLNTTISYNTAEGVRLRAGGLTTAALSKRWFGRGYIAYGCRDRRWKYNAEIEYSFIDKEHHAREFPVRSLRLSHGYDLDQIGQHYLYTNPDNMFLSLKRQADTRVTYLRHTALEWTCELRDNLSFNVSLHQKRQEATQWLPFIDGYGTNFSHFNESSMQFKVRFAPGEKFYQTHTQRIPINLDAPVIELSHTMAFKGFGSTMFNLQKTELTVGKRFWLSAFGYIDALAGAARVWSSSPYINLIIPNVNLSYTIQPESFALMNPMEFITDSYAHWHVTYWLNGLLFNQVPGLKLLKLREVVGFQGAYGTLSNHNRPELNDELFRFPADINVNTMHKTPYMELSAGIDNILRCLRIDYVWRLNYLHTPYKINKSGVRVALHVTF